MEVFTEDRFCKYCEEKLIINFEEGLECSECKSSVHSKCLRRGSVPGGLHGDIFFTFTCQECSNEETEVFSRIKLSWLQVVVLVLHHLHNKSPGLSRKGFFHWRHHIGKFIDKNWELLFLSENKKKKKWTGTIAGTLSHFSNYIFLSGNAVFNEPAVWALMYPKLSPFAVSSIYSVMMMEKQLLKIKKETLTPDADFFHIILRKCITHEECLQVFTDTQIFSESRENCENSSLEVDDVQTYVKQKKVHKRKSIGPQIGANPKMLKYDNSPMMLDEPITTSSFTDSLDKPQNAIPSSSRNENAEDREFKTLFDPYCHYNTSLSNISRMEGLTLRARLMGGIRPELILSPYSGIYLQPYIRRDNESFPSWMKLMAKIQIVGNRHTKGYVLPPRAPLDYCFIQPEHIPAINSLCNQFFWTGIDLTETLQYPDFSCVVLYKKLIVGFAFMVPDVSHTENYLSFIFVRPLWRNCGIGKNMLYHLIQVSMHKDLTLHVSTKNPAIILYQKLGFKIERMVRGFYERYSRTDTSESKNAFFCRRQRECSNLNFMKCSSSPMTSDEPFKTSSSTDSLDKPQNAIPSCSRNDAAEIKESKTPFDPHCHYNTTFSNISRMEGITLHAKLMGGIRPDLTLSPYSGTYLKPYIRRDTESYPSWMKLMAEIQVVGNRNTKDYVLPPRKTLDYCFVQPEHIPAINSLCNQFFWQGIDLTNTLQYPDFGCVVLYKRLVVGFAFLDPDVSSSESYLSFIFVRPLWRNCGIGKCMLHHLIQMSIQKDLTLHVSMNNPAMILYQKLGFKVERLVQGFYEKYLRSDASESKNAFFCRLEREYRQD